MQMAFARLTGSPIIVGIKFPLTGRQCSLITGPPREGSYGNQISLPRKFLELAAEQNHHHIFVMRMAMALMQTQADSRQAQSLPASLYCF